MGDRRGFFSSDTVERIRMSSDISAVVGRYVNLKPAGGNMKGLCPFHKEKTPSFFVSPTRQTYHCFGCGVGGDVFSFLMSYLSYSFREAVEEMATEAGVEIEYSAGGSSRTDVFRDIISVSHDFYRKQLQDNSGKDARGYIARRSLSPETANSLGMGLAPGGSRLTPYLRGKGYSESHLIEAGVSLRSSGGNLYDRFRERLLFPIGDRRGRTISFGGRLMESVEDVPKYINGPDSPIYRKGDYLYGYNLAARAARDLDMIILVEGYFDHARMMESGFACTVATCGTALTPQQARQLGTLSQNIFICFDGDSAGRKAAVRASEVILEQGHLPRVMNVPDDMDPDDYILERGPDGVLQLAEQAGDPVKYALGLLGEWSGIHDSMRKVKAVRRLVAIASAASDPVILETMLKVISLETGYSIETLKKQVEEEDGKRAKRSTRKLDATELNKWDSKLIAALLLVPENSGDSFFNTIQEGDFRSEPGIRIYKEIRRQSEEGLSHFQLSLMEDGDAAICSGIISLFPGGLDEEGLQRIEKAVIRSRLERQMNELKSRLLMADGEEKASLNREISLIGSKLKGM